jgi:hypothetical protein
MSEVIAAILGALVVWLTTQYTESRKTSTAKEQDAAHLGVVVLVHLDKLISECSAVAGDNGTVLGQPAGRDESGEDYYSPQTEVPVFQIEDLKVEWRSITPGLMYSIHSIPLQIRDALSNLEFVASIGDFDGSDFMEARRYRFAEIGVCAADLAAALRAETGIPPKPEQKWSPEKHLREQLEFHRVQEETRQATHQDWLAHATTQPDTNPS